VAQKHGASLPEPPAVSQGAWSAPQPLSADTYRLTPHFSSSYRHPEAAKFPKQRSSCESRVNGRLDLAHRLGAGGHEINGVVSANITSDKETGLGSWTDAQIRTALLKGKKPDGTLIASIMPWRYYAMLRPADIDSIVAYLHTVPPIHNKID
jgi:hypothetical protein